MANEIVIAAAGGFLGWFIIQCVSFFVIRGRLIGYLAVDISSHIRGIRDNYNWLSHLMQSSIKIGKKVECGSLYTRDELEEFDSLQEKLFSYLTHREIIKLTKAISAINEVEILFEGFCKSLCELHNAQKKLSKEEVNHLDKRAQRITALINILPAAITSVSDLPDDYSGRIPPTLLAPDIH